MIFLRDMTLRPPINRTRYPFSAQVMETFDRLSFTQPVTILCGENGSGKTTLMELAAAGAKAHTIGASGNRRNKTLLFKEAARKMRYTFNKQPMRSFYFTAEDFVRYLDERHDMRREAEQMLNEIENTYAGRSQFAKNQAAMAPMSTLSDMNGQYNRNLLESSHGEGFLSFFSARLAPDGLYLLDEPEGALSYGNQLSLLALIDQAVQMNCQVIMATHSPVLCAFPGAQLLSVEHGNISEVSYDHLESIQFLKYFLSNRSAVLKQAGIQVDSSASSD